MGKMKHEETELYRALMKGSKLSLWKAWQLIGSMCEEDINQRSEMDKCTYLHHVVNMAPQLYRHTKDVTPLIPLIYRLALRGVLVNAQDKSGNTALHLACFRPHADRLCPHLLRIGVDPAIRNARGCHIVHTYQNHHCAVVKGQDATMSGMWNAVEREDVELVEKLLKSWFRVNVHKNKSLKSLAEDIGNVATIKALKKYESTNELVCAAFSCDVSMVQEILCNRHVLLFVHQKDEALDIPKPLTVAIQELGEHAKEVLQLLEKHASETSEYQEKVSSFQTAFEDSTLYKLIMEGSKESFESALDLLTTPGCVDFHLRSFQTETDGWTYLHLLVTRYNQIKATNEELSRLLIRMMYRLALGNFDVNVRDAGGNTALVTAGKQNLDQGLLTHLIRIGCDPSVMAPDGRTVHEEMYEEKGKFVYGKKYKMADLPGLWVAVALNDVKKAERWLKTWGRVSVRRGDRKLLDIAQSLHHTQLCKILQEYDIINEFVCATIACDLKRMKHLLAMGQGLMKVNTIDNWFYVGFTWDNHAEFMARPIIVTALELCTPDVVDFLVSFGADLAKEHEESFPCGPVAFWAFHDHIDNGNTLVVAKHADVSLRDETGATMLHRAIQKKRSEGKQEIITILLDRGCAVAARDWDGSTARDYVAIFDVEQGDELRQMIDDHVLELVACDRVYHIETLIVDGYDHILDIVGTKKYKNALEIAEIKEYKDMAHLLKDSTSYRDEIMLLHESATTGDLLTICKLTGEKRCAWGRDLGGRTLLHIAVLYEHQNMVNFLLEQFPNLINTRDNRGRTPLHYCMCLEHKHSIWKLFQGAGADARVTDVNNLSVYDYVRELETPTSTKAKARGRRWQNYCPQNMMESEKNAEYGCKAATYDLYRALMRGIANASLQDVKDMTKNVCDNLSKYSLDGEVMKKCIDLKRLEIAKYVLQNCGIRPDVTIQKGDADSNLQVEEIALEDYAREAGMEELKHLVRKLLKTPERIARGNLEE